MNKNEKMWCHHLVRAAIGDQLKKNIFPNFRELLAQRVHLSPSLDQALGNFVTLKIDGELRGCIGTVDADVPLWQGLIHNAIASAFHDPRFESLQVDEFDFIEYQISILSKITVVSSLEKIEVGVHGLIAEQAGKRGLLLPQVPIEWNWDKQQYLEQVCIKAGLSASAWQDPSTKFYSFTAEVF